MSATAPLLKTPLHALHLELGARMVPFAGYDMPVQYRGIIAEHKQCRESAALFDVSHMGQLRLVGEDAARALESLVPVDVVDLAVGKQRYAFFTNSNGGLLDDLMITRRSGDLFLVVNAACKDADLAHLRTHIGHRCSILPLPDHALLALQGPKAATALARLNGDTKGLTFMTGGHFHLAGAECFVTRSGYTGEDGFEISVPAAQAEALARALLEQPEVEAAGLGARDTLRLEAGLCLYGHDINDHTTPVEAGLTWAIQKVRRPGGARAGGYPGAQVIDNQLAHGAHNKRVGLIGLERAPVREGTKLVDHAGHGLGHVTSGTTGPTVNQPISMAYLPVNHAAPGGTVYAVVREKKLPMRVCAMPFTPHRYHRG
ncbi:glycine cleavage system aminomethyltransferase GcvT [Aquabacterium sp. A7-Y]|uniref:glycine cleavage system aminomethyltransferase GcvT n=1 Tax=Aquabacterium sp. A7-Y TaxID=1349605 RepID=UPI00223C8E35|nr:glycine cleavage system aminomethyltransferase GcvT [Aquabacterium sp. A7-Y]MCW7541827.1 glycine cleavage system aminomethyltransferase GcvT [Aquabacterium sp. A7-Y]